MSSGLRRATAALVAVVPLAALQGMLATNAPWWRMPLERLERDGAIALGIWALVAVGLLRAKKWAWRLALVLAIAWSLSTIWMAVRMRNPSLGFFAVGLAAILGGLLAWLRHEIGRSFLDPRMRWYQGLPKAIPGLACRVPSGDLRVCRIDQEGAFVYRGAEGAAAVPTSPGVPVELLFQFREKHVRCLGVPVQVFTEPAGAAATGAGFRFQGMSADMNKDLGDFIESLRGEGHVE
jgi:hypothetical protein